MDIEKYGLNCADIPRDVVNFNWRELKEFDRIKSKNNIYTLIYRENKYLWINNDCTKFIPIKDLNSSWRNREEDYK